MKEKAIFYGNNRQMQRASETTHGQLRMIAAITQKTMKAILAELIDREYNRIMNPEEKE